MKYIKKHPKLIMLLITIISLLFRIVFINGKTGDYLHFLNPWVISIRNLGYFKSLKYSIGNYNVPYMFLLTLISFYKGAPLYLIKMVSIIFDIICALFGYKITKNISKDTIKSIIVYAAILFIPTVIINGALWGQCDSIYTAFTLISLYFLLNKKYTLSFIFLGVSFAFKLQAVFILPLYVILFFKEKKIHLYHFLLIPLVDIVLCLPAIIAGRSIKDCLLIYLNQANEYNALNMNFPNLYVQIDTNIKVAIKYGDLISKIGILITFLLFLLMFLYTLLKKVKFNKEKIILLGLWSIVIATYFLPHMHERYMFAADIIAVIYSITYEKKFYIPLSICLASFLAYMKVLFDYQFINLSIVSYIYGIFIIVFTIDTIRILGVNYEKRKN